MVASRLDLCPLSVPLSRTTPGLKLGVKLPEKLGLYGFSTKRPSENESPPWSLSLPAGMRGPELTCNIRWGLCC